MDEPNKSEELDDKELKESDSENELNNSDSDEDDAIEYADEDEDEDEDDKNINMLVKDGNKSPEQNDKKKKDYTKYSLNIEDEYDDNLNKLDEEFKHNYIALQHSECLSKNFDEILQLTKVIRNKDNIIVDEFHKTIPVLTKYERTRVLYERSQMISNGVLPYISNPEKYDSIYEIVEKELKEKKIPFIIKRTLNGNDEYIKLEDFIIL